jgi:hypothetical protein
MVLRVLVLMALMFALLWGAAGVWAWHTYHAAEYPGSTATGAENLWRYKSNITFKRTETYRSTDAFNVIYNYYGIGFGLGPERFAHGNCALMAHAKDILPRLHWEMSAMVCETKTDRMIFVSRTYSLRLPKWLQDLVGRVLR